MSSDITALNELIERAERLDELLKQGESASPTDGSLPAHIPAGLYLLHAVFGSGLPTGVPTNPDTAPLNAPALKSIGRFEIWEQLGAGSFGVVYRAFDPVLKRDVALKVPRLHTTLNDGLLNRFLREGEAAARLHHPYIVPVYEAGFEGSTAFICAEYIPGPTLAEWLKRRREPVSPETAAEMLVGLADGVEHAHQAGILHRDLKPGNLLLIAASEERRAFRNVGRNSVAHPIGGQRMPEGDLRQDIDPSDVECDGMQTDPVNPAIPMLKITDFGLARFMDQSGSTMDNGLLGTINYMSPEQVEGCGDLIGPATDIHALGVILYELLTRQRPHVADSSVEVMRRIAENEPLHPDRLRRGIPRDLTSICLKCLHKAPHRRYATAAALRDDLQCFLDGRPTVARPISSIERLIRWTRGSPAIATTVVMSLLVLSGLVLQANRHNRRLSEAVSSLATEKQRADAAAEAADRQRDRAEIGERRALGMSYASNMRLATESHSAGNNVERDAALNRCLPLESQVDLRGFEWHLLHGFAARNSDSWQAHEEAIYTTSLAPDTMELAVGSADQTARVWNLQTRTCRLTLSGHTDEINKVQFNSDGTLIATASDDTTVRIWDATTGKTRAVLNGHTKPVYGVDFIATGNRIVTGSADGTLRLWSLTGTEISTVRQGQQIEDVDVSPDGRMLAVAAGNQMLTLDLLTLKEREAPRAEFCRYATSVRFSPDGRFLASTMRGPLVHVWDTSTGSRLAVLQGHTNVVHGMEFVDNGDRIASVSRDGTARIWSLKTALTRQTFRDGSSSPTDALVWSGKHDLAVVAYQDGSLRVWDFHRDGPIQSLQIYPIETTGQRLHTRLALSPEEDHLYVCRPIDQRLIRLRMTPDGLEDQTVVETFTEPEGNGILCSLAAGRPALARSRSIELATADAQLQSYPLPADTGEIQDCDYSQHDGSQHDGVLATCHAGGALHIWNVRTHSLQKTIRHARTLHSVCLLGDGRTVVTGDSEGLLNIWDIQSGEMLERRTTSDDEGHLKPVTAIELSPNGDRVACISNGFLSVWSVVDWSPIDHMAVDEDLLAVRWQDERTVIATGTGGIHRWELTEGRSPRTILGTNERLWSLKIEEDGRRVLATDGTGRIHIAKYDAPAQTQITDLPCRIQQMTAVAFNDDLSKTAVLDFAGSAELWETRTGTQSGRVRSAKGGCAATFDSSGRRLYIEHPGRGVSVWDQHDSVVTIKKSDFQIGRIMVSPHEREIAVAWRERNAGVDVLDAHTGQLVKHIDTTMYDGLGYLPRTGSLLVLESQQSIAAWHVADTQPAFRLKTKDGCIGFQASPDESVLITFHDGSGGTFLSLWNLDRRKNTASLIGHSDRVKAAAFSPDARTLATASEDGTLRLWHVETGQQIGVLHRQAEPLFAVAFSKDGRTLAAAPIASVDGQTVRFWTIDEPQSAE